MATAVSDNEHASAEAKFNEDRFLNGRCVATDNPRLK